VTNFKHLRLAALYSASLAALATPAAAQTHNWTGFYIGGTAGYSSTSTRWSDLGLNGTPWTDGSTHKFSTDGAAFGLLTGYNFQSGYFVGGVEADLSYSTGSERFNWPAPNGGIGTSYIDAEANWLATFRGRLGFAFDRLFVFGTGGLAYGDPSAHWFSTGGAQWVSDGWRTGYVWGGGAEYALNQNWSVRFDVMRTTFKTTTPRDVTPAGTADFGNTAGYTMQSRQAETTARLGAIFKF
jgi:outer membrane immunogenic protein